MSTLEPIGQNMVLKIKLLDLCSFLSPIRKLIDFHVKIVFIQIAREENVLNIVSVSTYGAHIYGVHFLLTPTSHLLLPQSSGIGKGYRTLIRTLVFVS